ncbi:MAG TPA: FAD-binding oxidoreductase [Jatrophihabitantaceae bacterium]|jgi:glycine/D-amino acid oxidase-like deaminating enzyme|nr:FAD-binding oxidoreductase [Jatrophihabitantaceae bacterium]
MQNTVDPRPLAVVRSSLWMEQALSDELAGPSDTLTGRTTTDICIVGGGYTGLWTALAIKDRDPSVQITLLEASVCGAGASGANGGFAMTWWPKWSTLKKLVGSDAAAVARASETAVAEIGDFVAANGVAADFTAAGWLWAATNSAQLGSWQETIDGWAESGESPYSPVDSATAAAMTGSPTHLGGVFESGVATLHPGRLVRALRRIAIDRGVRIHENTPMTSMYRQGARTVVQTPQGTVAASQIVLATNAALVAYREIRRHLVLLGSDVVATAPCADQISDWDPGLAVSDSRRLVHYYRTTKDDRVVFGKGGGRVGFGKRLDPRFWGPSERAEEVTGQLHRTFPRLRPVPITHSWSGAVDYSIDSMPFFGSLSGMPNVHFVAGFSGDGVGPSRLAGHVLASRALGVDDEWSNFPLVREPRGALPPEPARFLGGQIVRRAISRKEAFEDAERRPGRTLVTVAGLDPTSFVG